MRKIKRKVAAKRRLSLLTFALSTLLPIYAATHDPDFQCAILRGATAQISVAACKSKRGFEKVNVGLVS